jgi:hypothetical protein
MKSIVQNIVAVVLGLVLGSVANMTLVNLGPMVFPPPEGADITSLEGLRETIKLFKPENFLFPFLGHAIGTLVGAFAAAKIAASHKMRFAFAMGIVFLIGGIMMIVMVGGPIWFMAGDLLLAYIPMAILGGRFGGGSKMSSLAN